MRKYIESIFNDDKYNSSNKNPYISSNQTKYLKYWLLTILLFTLFFCIGYFLFYNDTSTNLWSDTCLKGVGPLFTDPSLNTLRSATPAYPPPLTNFMDASFNPF